MSDRSTFVLREAAAPGSAAWRGEPITWSRLNRARSVNVVGFVPKEMFFTKGVGKHREKLT